MSDLFPLLGHWFWFIVAGVFLFFELTAPGVFFIWLAAAAVVTGIAGILIAMSWQAEVIVFAAIAMVSVLSGRAYLKSRDGGTSENPNLNRRMHDYVGRNYVLEAPIVNGKGELTIEGTIWRIKGEDAAKGTRVKVTGIDGLQLIVSQE